MELEAIRELNQGHVAHDPASQQAALDRMGNSTSDELTELALEGLGDPDRNVRFKMHHLLGTRVRPEAARKYFEGAHNRRRVRPDRNPGRPTPPTRPCNWLVHVPRGGEGNSKGPYSEGDPLSDEGPCLRQNRECRIFRSRVDAFPAR